MRPPGRPKGEYRSAQHDGTPVSDDDIHAFGASAAAAVPAARALPGAGRSRWWLWLLGALALLTLLAALVGAAALAAIAESSRDGIQLTIDGQTWPLLGLDGNGGLVALLGIGLALFIVLLVVPLVLLLVAAAVVLALGLAGVAVAGSVAAGLAVALLAVGLVLSPVWGTVLLLWWLLRRRGSAAAPAGATAA